ncbi:hypothetical protein BDW62DRAFT_175101 [Aspergillus aurantiobrunneus]
MTRSSEFLGVGPVKRGCKCNIICSPIGIVICLLFVLGERLSSSKYTSWTPEEDAHRGTN